MGTIRCNRCETDNPGNARYCIGCGYELSKPVQEKAETEIRPKSSAKKGNPKKAIGAIVGALAFLLAYFAVQQLFPPVSIDGAIMKMASEMNKNCPFMVDAETRLDNTIALPGKTIQYNYTLVNIEKSDVDTVLFKSQMEPVIIRSIKDSPDMEFHRKNKMTSKYSYKDKNGLYICSISVTPDQYK